jgi:hypothetical protein
MYVNFVGILVISYEIVSLPYKYVNSVMHNFTFGGPKLRLS